MRVALASDLHLEFGDINLINDRGAEVLILSGDIMTAQDLHDHPELDRSQMTEQIYKNLGHRQAKAFDYRNFLKRCSFQFPHVVYVAGNHEFYHGKFPANINDLRNECSKFPNVYFMENDCKRIGDYTFIGCTLWTDMNKGDPLTLHAVQHMMNDYQIIRHSDHGYTKLRPAHTADHHRRSVEYIKTVVAEKHDEKFVVVGHMAPSKQSTHPRYKDEYLTNGAYSSDLSEFILDRPHIKLWTHGHTHDRFDYMIGSTRIVCNPRGYIGYETCADEFELQYLDI